MAVDDYLRRWDIYGIYHAVSDLHGMPRLCDLRGDNEAPFAGGVLTYWPFVTCVECLGKMHGQQRVRWNGFAYEWRLL